MIQADSGLKTLRRVESATMESNLRYYARRAAAETLAAERAITPEARARRSMLAESYREKLRALGA
jgi:hypothetical protein